MLAALAACAGPMPTNLGAKDGALTPCPDSPNCVSSFSPDADHSVKPLPYKGDAKDAIARLQKAILAMSGTALVRADDAYLHITFTTDTMGFIDDVELLADPKASVVHVRSASRVGYSDLGANRERVEAIRKAFAP